MRIAIDDTCGEFLIIQHLITIARAALDILMIWVNTSLLKQLLLAIIEARIARLVPKIGLPALGARLSSAVTEVVILNWGLLIIVNLVAINTHLLYVAISNVASPQRCCSS